MKTLTIVAAAAAALLASAAAEARAPLQPRPGMRGSEVPIDCPFTIGFSSYGAGIDRPALLRVEHMLGVNRAVRGVSRHLWGREGEVTLCVRARRQGDYAGIARSVRQLLPPRPRGPITIDSRAQRQYGRPQPRR